MGVAYGLLGVAYGRRKGELPTGSLELPTAGEKGELPTGSLELPTTEKYLRNLRRNPFIIQKTITNNHGLRDVLSPNQTVIGYCLMFIVYCPTVIGYCLTFIVQRPTVIGYCLMVIVQRPTVLG